MKHMYSFAALAVIFFAVSSTAACADKSKDFEPPSYALSVPAETVLGIPSDGSVESISDSFEVVEVGKESVEGDPYDFMVVKVANDLNVRIVFDGASADGSSRAYYFEISSLLVYDPNGLRVGSQLGSVMDAWPDGHFISGFTDGKKFARYSTGRDVIFAFDPDDFEDACFDESAVKCDPSRRIDVERIFVYPGLRASS